MLTLRSGWGDRISIAQTADQLQVERVMFLPREVQLPVRYRFAMNGAETENAVNVGRTGPAPISTAAWDQDRLVLTTRYPLQNPQDGSRHNSEVMQTMWLQAATGTPWEPVLVVETRRGAALDGRPSVNRTIYYRAYR